MVEQIKKRTFAIALESIRISRLLFGSPEGGVIAKQFIRAGTSIGANYRAATRAKSKADFINKLKIVEEEADELLYWMEIMASIHLVNPGQISFLMKETNEIISIVVASINTARKNLKNCRF